MSGSPPVPDAAAPVNSGPEFWKRLAWTLGPLAAFCALSHVPLIGLDVRILGELIRLSDDNQGGVLVRSASTMSIVRALSIGVLGLSYLPVSLGLVLVARSASARFEARLDAEGGWDGVMRWARRLTVVVTLLVSWSMLGLFVEPYRNRTATLFLHDGLLSFYVPNLAAILGATAVAMWLAQAISRRGLGDGFLGLLAVQALFRVVPMVNYLPVLMRTGSIGVESLLLPGASILLVVALTGIAILGSRRIPLYRASAPGGDDPWPRGLVLPVASAAVWPWLAAVALGDVLPEVARFLDLRSAGWWLGGTALNRLVVQLAVFAVLAPRAATVATNAVRIAEDLKKRGARIPGVRPGDRTAARIRAIQRRLTAAFVILLSAAAIASTLADHLWRRIFQSSAASGTRWLLISAAVWLVWKSAKEAIQRDKAATDAATAQPRPFTPPAVMP